MKRLMSFAILVSLALTPLAAQSTAGWKVRADRSTSATDPDGAGKIQFMAMGKGFHAINPQAAVYWNPANTAKGAFTVKGTFTLNEPSNHNNYYGLTFGGSNLTVDMTGASKTFSMSSGVTSRIGVGPIRGEIHFDQRHASSSALPTSFAR